MSQESIDRCEEVKAKLHKAAYEKRFELGLARGMREFLTGGEVSPKFLAKLEAATEADE